MLRKSITLSLQEEVDLIKNKGGFAISLSNPSFNPRNLENINLNNYNIQGLLSGEKRLKEIARKKLFSNWKTNNLKNDVLITNGAKAALYCVFKTVANKNNTNIGIINPNWPTYIDLINSKYGIEDFANKTNTISNEVLTSFGKRVKRIYF